MACAHVQPVSGKGACALCIARVSNIRRGDDLLNGGGGRNVLTGGEGADIFEFDTLKAAGGHDQIKDFLSGVDTIRVDTGIFTALAAYGVGTLDTGELTYGSTARQADQHLIYNAAKGHLIYDADGVGGEAGIIIGAFSSHPDLQAGDIVLF